MIDWKFFIKKIAKSLSVRIKCVILQPNSIKKKKNEESIQCMVVAQLKIEQVVSNPAVWILQRDIKRPAVLTTGLFELRKKSYHKRYSITTKT